MTDRLTTLDKPALQPGHHGYGLDRDTPPCNGSCKQSALEEASTPDDIYVMPATQGQIRFWSLDQLHPGSPGLNMPLMWQCKGDLNVKALTRAFAAVVRRHEVLRTTFAVVDGELRQVIGRPYDVALPIVNLQHLPDASNSLEAKRLIRDHAAIRMDLFEGPLLFTKLLRFSSQHHLLLVTMHHIICDGISLGILLRDVAVIYEALAEEKEAGLPDLPIQFADFAVWQEEWRKTNAAEQSLDFWRKTLGREFARSNLQRDLLPKTTTLENRVDSPTGNIETLLIPPRLVEAAHQFCKQQETTFNILLFTVFCALLSRVSGQNEVTVGSPCANRTEETEDLIGLFMNVQVLRLKLDASETFNSLVRKVEEWTLGAYENQMLPFEDLVYDPYFSEASSAFEIPIFFLYQKSFMVTQNVAGLEIVPLRSMSPGAVFELMLAIVDRPEEGPRLQLEYNPQHYRAATIRGLLDLFVELLESSLQSPLEQLASMPIQSKLPPAAPSKEPLDTTRPPSPRATNRRKKPSALCKDPVEAQLLDLWRSTLGTDEITVDTNLFSVGATSLNILRLVTRMNKLHSMNFGLASLFSASTIKELAALVRKRYAPNTSSLVPIQPAGSKPPLYIIHGAGGNVVNFYGLSKRIGLDQPVYGIQAQALEPGQPALLKIEDMAAHYLNEIRKIQPVGPYHFLGYSFGGIVALEMAQQLMALGEPIGLISMLDSRARDYMTKEQRDQASFGQTSSGSTIPKGYLDSLSEMSRSQALRRDLRVRLVRYMITLAAKMVRTLPAFLKDTHEINSVAARNYRLAPFNGKLTLFRASVQADETVPVDNGWAPFFTRGVQVHEIPGDHWHVLFEPGIDVLAHDLQGYLSHSGDLRSDSPSLKTGSAMAAK